MAELTLGINNGFVAKLWPEPTRWAALISVDLGLKEVQFSFDLLDPSLPCATRFRLASEIRAAADLHGLTLRSAFTGGIAYAQNLLHHPDSEMQAYYRRWYESAIDLTTRLGGEATGGHLGAMSVSTYEDPSRLRDAKRRLVRIVRDLGAAAAAAGHKYFLWELMPSPLEPPHSPEEVLELLAEVNSSALIPIRLCFDLGHCCAWTLPEPGKPEEWLSVLLPHVQTIHLQQTDGKHDCHWPFVPRHQSRGVIRPYTIAQIARESPLARVDLVLELTHPVNTRPDVVADEYKRSVAVWAEAIESTQRT